jgi:hypothetical protein
VDVRRSETLTRSVSHSWRRCAALAATVALTVPAASWAQQQPTPGSSPEAKAGSTAGATAGQTSGGETAGNLSKRQAIRIARTDGKFAAQRRKYGHLEPSAQSKPGSWQIDFYAGGVDRVQVVVDDLTGTVRESWTGYQIAWPMARGYSGQFGHILNSPYVWGLMAVLFFLGLLDWQRPWRAVHLDLLVLLGFGISEAFFNAGEIGVSVPLAYPPLVYLLARMLSVGFRGLGEGLRPSAPIAVLAVLTAFLVGFRVALNIADSGVIDVGLAGAIGADHLIHGQAIWNNFPTDNPFGDTYGPFNYLAYVPFDLVLPWSGHWDDVPAAHAAAILFDLVAIAGLFTLGRRLRPRRAGTDLGIVLAFAWAAYPFTDYALQSNSNDTLVAALLIWALVAFSSPLKRGALLALAAATKFAPLALAPLFASGQRGLAVRPWALRPALIFSASLLAVIGVMLALPAVDPGLATFYDRTIKSQLDRSSPFSIWGQDHSLEWVQTIVKAFAVGLAVLVAFVPRRRSLYQVGALAAAVTIAVQLTAEHWFYLYIPWFFGLVLCALVGAGEQSSQGALVAAPGAFRYSDEGAGKGLASSSIKGG